MKKIYILTALCSIFQSALTMDPIELKKRYRDTFDQQLTEKSN